MKNWEEDDRADYCAAARDLTDAQSVANLLGIPLHRVNFATEYWDRVFAHFLDEYRAGRTPNPDVLCNKEIKFRAFLDHALTLGAKWIATGHYARVAARGGEWRLLLSADPEKDQTYFLHLLDQHQLAHSLFPLGGLTKSQVRALAQEAGLPNAHKRDSTGICFIGEKRFRDFLRGYLAAQPGEIITSEGEHLGTHQGLVHYTIGQRQGLGIGGIPRAPEAPWFVAGKEIDHNRLIVVQRHDHPLLYGTALETGPLHWVGTAPALHPSLQCLARIRHRHPLTPCRVEAITGGRGRVRFERPQWALAPGQSVVFYRDNECLGGAIIQQINEPNGTQDRRVLHRP